MGMEYLIDESGLLLYYILNMYDDDDVIHIHSERDE